MKNLRRFRTMALATVLIAALAGCESLNEHMTDISHRLDRLVTPSPDKEVQPPAVKSVEIPCPPVRVVEELRAVHQFLDKQAPRAENNVSTIVISNVNAKCVKNENNLVVDLAINMEGRIGPKARLWNAENPSFAYPYFIATTAENRGILAKEVFGLTISYNQENDYVRRTENIRQIIPTTGPYANADYELLIGFQLTDAELAYNRALLDAGEAVDEPYMAEQLDVVEPSQPPLETPPVATPKAAPARSYAPETAPLPLPKPQSPVEEQPAEAAPAPEATHGPVPETATMPEALPESETAAPEKGGIPEPIVEEPKTLDELMESLTGAPADGEEQVPATQPQEMSPPPSSYEPTESISEDPYTLEMEKGAGEAP